MARLPQVGGDRNNWGDILNEFLAQAHNNNGTLKADSVGATQLQPNSVMAPSLGNGQVTAPKLADNAVTMAKIAGAGQASGIATLDGSAQLPETQVPSRLSESALNGAFVRPRVQTGSSYPSRIPGATNIFIGPTDPGLAMDAVHDVWTGPSTTLDTVSAAAVNTGSGLYAAIQSAAATSVSRRFVPASELAPVDNRPPTLENFSTTANTTAGLPGWMFPSGSTTVAGALVETPPGWSQVRVRLLWSHDVASPSGDVTWFVRGYPVSIGTVLSAGGSAIQVTDSVPETKVVQSALISNVANVNPGGDLLRLNIARLGASDSFPNSAGLIGLWVERTA